MCPLEYRGCATPGAGWPLKTCIFRGFGAQKTISSYSFDRIVLIFGYIVERTILKFSRAIFAIFILNPNYDVINDVISGFAKVVIERCGFRHWIAERISWGEVVSVFLYLLQFPSYDVMTSSWRNFQVCESCRRAMRIAPLAVNHRSVAASSLINRSSVYTIATSIRCINTMR